MSSPVSLPPLVENKTMSVTDIYTLEFKEKLFSLSSGNWGLKDRKGLSKDGRRKGRKRERILDTCCSELIMWLSGV